MSLIKFNLENKMEEIWKDVITHPEYYQVSNFGNVRRKHIKVIQNNQFGNCIREYPALDIKSNLNTDGYLQLVLNFGARRVARVHRLVAEAFLSEPSDELKEECDRAGTKVFINHKDLDKTNNHVSNLEWCSPSFNNLSKNRLVPQLSGSNHYAAVLTEDNVREILQLKSESKLSQQKIADIFGVKQITISNIFTGRSWNQITGFPVKERSVKKKAKCLSDS